MKENDLCATWELDRFWFTDEKGDEMDPLGTDPRGNLILGKDGNYAFTIMRVARTNYASGDLLGGTLAEKGEAADGYVSFGGRWQLDGEAITFDVTYSFFPNWVNKQQKRLASLGKNSLTLRTTGPILMAGRIHRGAARWHRL